jgi:hypothetical protein
MPLENGGGSRSVTLPYSPQQGVVVFALQAIHGSAPLLRRNVKKPPT